ncbi:Polyadenylate-binding protein 2 [Gossypium australe]|uniref:Polyadenylate-binding protein 2 n=1 Tax=Gossypium australe TaxID=47621 RepID=A0A5B6UFN6_9ROSI|nr:Polyadenylate-binding protein 2 [Gossypium australe]
MDDVVRSCNFEKTITYSLAMGGGMMKCNLLAKGLAGFLSNCELAGGDGSINLSFANAFGGWG